MGGTAERSYERKFSSGIIAVGLINLAFLIGGFFLVFTYRDIRFGLTWSAKVTATMLYQYVFLFRHRTGILSGDHLDHLWGIANKISLARGLMISLLAGFLFSAKATGAVSWLPALLYTFIAILDFFDGFWARRSNTTTQLGELLDQECGSLGILVAVILAIQWELLPIVFLYIGVAKYVFVAGLAWRTARGKEVHPLPESFIRRQLAGFQMGILAVVLWPIAKPPATVLAETIIGIPLLVVEKSIDRKYPQHT